jgi:hypothetical protein
MKKLAIFAFVAVAVSANASTLITEWNFNVSGGGTGTGTLTPNVGAGTASLLGGTTSTWASGLASGGSSDLSSPDNSAWNLSTWPAQGTNSGTAGSAFFVDTSLWDKLTVEFDMRHSNTSSRYVQFRYTTDGGATWSSNGLLNDGVFQADAGGDKWYNNRTVDLTAIAGVGDNPNFGFSIVTIFAPGTAGYVASTSTSTYGTAGTLRHDMVQVYAAEVVPEPASMAALAVGALALLRRRRAR